jgi:hypothetical protein
MRPTTTFAALLAFTSSTILIAPPARGEDKAPAAPAAAPAAAAAAPAVPAPPRDETNPQGAAASIAASGSATVVAVDPDARLVILRTAEGDMIPVKCGKDVVNFDQIAAGDEVKAMAVDRVVVYIGVKPPEQTDGRVILRNAEGERPGILISDTTTASAKVGDVNADGKSVALIGADGKAMQYALATGVKASDFKKGDEVAVRTTSGIALSVQRPAQPGEAQPAGAEIGAETRTATVESVDRAQRAVTLRTADGKTRVIQVGGDAVNFDQIEPGDQVTATVAESVAVAIDKADAAAAAPSAAPRTGAQQGERAALIMKATKGNKPGLLIAATKGVTGKIESIDSEKQIITLTPADGGKAMKFKATPGLDISQLKAGDDVRARVTESLAIVVAKPIKLPQ